jgi:hypothetical protein
MAAARHRRMPLIVCLLMNISALCRCRGGAPIARANGATQTLPRFKPGSGSGIGVMPMDFNRCRWHQRTGGGHLAPRDDKAARFDQ